MSISTELRNALSYPKELARNYFAQRVVYPWELPAIMRKHIYTGAMGSLYYTLMGGIFFIYFGNAIGITRPMWGVMSGLSQFMLASQLLSAFMTERLGRRKVLWFTSALLGRSLRVAGILVALWLWRAGQPDAALFMVTMVVASNFFDALAEPPWLSWLGDIIPEEQHGRFWGRRAAWIAFATVCVIVPAGLAMDFVPEGWRMTVTICVFILAGVLGIVDLFIHGTLPEPALALPEQSRAIKRFMEPLADTEFRPWLLFTLVWSFSMSLGGSLGWLYFFDELGIKNNFLGGTLVMIALPLVGNILTGKWSGKLVDIAGISGVLFWGHIVWATLPLYWLVATPATALIFLGFSSVVGGMGSTAATNAANKLVTRLPAPENRAMYAAVSRCAGNFAGGLGAFAAGATLALLGGWHTSVFGWTVAAFPILFVISLVLRLSSAIVFIRRIGEPRLNSSNGLAAA